MRNKQFLKGIGIDALSLFLLPGQR